jgi:hypothetical protein
MLFNLVAGVVLTIVFVVHPVIGNPRTFMEKQLGELFVEVFMFFTGKRCLSICPVLACSCSFISHLLKRNYFFAIDTGVP